jgi:hypothetical protein
MCEKILYEAAKGFKYGSSYVRTTATFYIYLNKTSKQSDKDKINEILDQANAPEWHEAMVNATIEIFEISYKEYISYFKHLENLEKIRCTNGLNFSSLPVDNKKPVTSNIAKSSKNLTCGVTNVTRKFKTRLISEQVKSSNSRKRLALKPKLELERSLWSSCS